jgi:hypothetical protein
MEEGRGQKEGGINGVSRWREGDVEWIGEWVGRRWKDVVDKLLGDGEWTVEGYHVVAGRCVGVDCV